MDNWGLLGVALMASATLTWIILQVALRNQIVDVPVDRSAHSQPTPTGGGVAMVVSFYTIIGYWFFDGLVPAQVVLILLGGIAVALLGFFDDVGHLGIRWRLSVQFIAAIWAIAWLGDAPEIQFGAWNLNITGLVLVLATLALVWLLNLYNFMDGIDGLAATEACSVALIALMLAINSSDQVVTLLSALLGAVTVGFLLFNWPPAKIFMGDSGSGFLGFSLGIIALLSMQHGSINFWAWLLLLGVFVVDATYTLICRFLSGQKWYAGHDTHAYQKAAKLWGSHKQVTVSVLAINLLWLAPLAWLANLYPQKGLLITMAGLLPLLYFARYFEAGKVVSNND